MRMHQSLPSFVYVMPSSVHGYRVFPGGKERRGVTLTPQPLLVLWSWKSRAAPLLPLWVVRPVQSLSACTVQGYTLPLPFSSVESNTGPRWQQRCTSFVRDGSTSLRLGPVSAFLVWLVWSDLIGFGLILSIRTLSVVSSPILCRFQILDGWPSH